MPDWLQHVRPVSQYAADGDSARGDPTATRRGSAQPRTNDGTPHSGTRSGWIKLYNSGNFFDPRSIPPADYASIAARCESFSRLVVENHPKFGADRLRRFRDLVSVPLEIAVGLETVQPRWLSRLEKQMSRDDFDRYARWLHNQGVDLRVFLIIGVPGVSAAESIRWTRLSVRHAIACGARHVSLIPARRGHGWSGLADRLPKLSVDAIVELQHTAIVDAGGRAAITIDLWDFESDADQLQRLVDVNLTQRVGE